MTAAKQYVQTYVDLGKFAKGLENNLLNIGHNAITSKLLTHTIEKPKQGITVMYLLAERQQCQLNEDDWLLINKHVEDGAYETQMTQAEQAAFWHGWNTTRSNRIRSTPRHTKLRIVD